MQRKSDIDPIDRGALYAQRLLDGVDKVLLASMGIGYGPTYSDTEVKKLIQRAWADGYKACEREST